LRQTCSTPTGVRKPGKIKSMHRILALVVAVCSIAAADTLRLKSGQTVEGTYLGGDARNIRFDNGDKVQSYAINDVAEIKFGSTADSGGTLTPAPAPAAPAAAPAAGAPAPAPVRPAVQNRAEAATSKRTGNPTEVPAGTPLVIRLIDDVDSQRDAVGQEFKASIDEPVVVGERTVIARGADVIVRLTEDKQSGKLSGKTELTLDIVSVVVNGRAVDVMTAEVSQSSGSRTNKTGQVVGGGAALGAIIGAIAGGGKGAAIGAVSGAAAGGAVQVLTKGERVKIPSETRLTFTLQQPFRI
jgi:hypothetical protein